MAHPDAGLNPPDEPCFLTPADDLSILDPQRERPAGPLWWLGLWPDGGIGSLEDLEKYVEARLTKMIRFHWAEPEFLGDLGLRLGQQAVTNAIGYLARFGRGDLPRRPIADELQDVDGVQAALEALLVYLRQARSEEVTAAPVPEVYAGPDGGGSAGGEPEVAAAAAVPAAVERAPNADTGASTEAVAVMPPGLVVDRDHFTILWNGTPCRLGNTREFAVIECLSRKPGKNVTYGELFEHVWLGEETADNTIQKTVSNLRKKLTEAGITEVTIQPERGHYALILP